MVHLKSRFCFTQKQNKFLQKLRSSLFSNDGGEGITKHQLSLAAASPAWRGHTDVTEESSLKSHWWCNPKIPPAQSFLRWQRIITLDVRADQYSDRARRLTPPRPSLLHRSGGKKKRKKKKEKPARWLQKLKAMRWMRSKICSNHHPHPCSQDRRNHSAFVEAARTSEASLNSFSLLIVHNSYSAAEIWMPLCVAGSSARARHEARGPEPNLKWD